MKMKSKLVILIVALGAICLAPIAKADVTTNTVPFGSGPGSGPLGGDTTISNALASAAQSGLPQVQAVLNLLPAWDPTATNTFSDTEYDIETAPLWKAMTQAGTTPYNSTEGDYFFSRNFGIGGEIISLGDGSGNSTIDTLNCNITLRKDVGNIAGYLLAGGGYDFNIGKPEGAIGPGIVYGYRTGIRLFLDTRCELAGTAKQDIGWLTRLGIQLAF